MDLSYREKSLIASLAVTLLVFGWYFLRFFSSQMFGNNDEFTFIDILMPIILIVVLEVIIQSFLAGKNTDKEDERDALIAARSYKNGYWLLGIEYRSLVFIDATFVCWKRGRV